MQTQRQQGETCAGQPIPAGFVPEGIAATRTAELFDETLLSLLKALPSRYLAIFSHLLRYATLDPQSTIQFSLFPASGESNHEAIVLFKSVEALAKSPGSPAGPETYLKALLLYEALTIIQRKFHRGYTEVRIPLGKREILIPTLLQSLRRLHETYHNVKVQQLARKTALILQSGAFLARLPHPVTSSNTALKEALLRLLREHGIAEQSIDQTSLAQTCTVLVQIIKCGSVADPEGVMVASPRQLARNTVGTSSTQTGVFSAGAESQAQHEPDLEHTQPGELLRTEAPVLKRGGAKRRHCSLQKADLDALFGPEAPVAPHNGRFQAHWEDSLPGVSMSVSSPSGFLFQEKETLIDAALPETENTPVYVDTRPHLEIEREMLVYKKLFDRGPGRNWNGSLYNAVKWTPPEIRRVAAIGAIFYQHFRQPDGSFAQKPGGWFTSACKRYRLPGAEIPPELKIWDETHLPLDQIEKQIKIGIRHPVQLAFPFEGASVALVDGPSFEPEDHALPLSPSSRDTTWMNRRCAEDLCKHIEREGQRFAIRARVLPGEQTGVFVVITCWAGITVQHHNRASWDDYFAETRSCLE